MAAITRLGLAAIPRGLHGSYATKENQSFFPGTVPGDGGHIWPAREGDPRWTRIIADSGITASGNFIDDVFAALEASTGLSNYQLDDLWDFFKQQWSVTDTTEPFLY